MRSFNCSDLSAGELQSYLNHMVAPRPIALVSTVDNKGQVNLSPFSFFNLFSINPPLCVFSPSRRVRDNTTKHTLENLKEVPECVIQMVTYSMVQQTSLSSTEYPKGVNEFDKAGFTAISSEVVSPPRVKESPFQLECRVKNIVSLGEGPGAGNLVLAEIVRFHLDESLLNREGHVNEQKLDLVARMGGDWYARIGAANLFKVLKPGNEQCLGIDELPAYIRNSNVLTGNDLARLGGVSFLPPEDLLGNYLEGDSEMMNQLNNLSSFPESRLSYVHQRAKTLLKKDKVQEAWLTLLAGAQYEEMEMYNINR